uniref:Uncharacterized protein n=1 Tax=Arundo donax TaxID=35708 RepID=A0A0A9A004_ARUDO
MYDAHDTCFYAPSIQALCTSMLTSVAIKSIFLFCWASGWKCYCRLASRKLVALFQATQLTHAAIS